MTSTLGLLITLACFSTIFGHREEPINSCTRIDFEEKMLMKMVTLQVTVETTLSSINAKLEEFSAEKAKLMKDIEAFKVNQKEELMAFKVDLKKELGAFKVDQKEELGAFKVATDDVMKQQTTQQEQFIKEMSSKYDTMVSQTDGMVQRIQADAQNATQELQVDLKEEFGAFKATTDDVIKEMSSKYDTMVSQTDGMEQRIQADIQNATQELQERLVQEPVAFIARSSSGFTAVAGNTLIFDTIVQNIGGGYDTTDSTFTAPLAGAYVLSAQVCIESGKYITFQIRSKDTLYSVSRHGESDFNTMCSSVSTVAVLTAGEKVWVMCQHISSSGLYLYSDSVNVWTMFSGALVQPAV